MISSMSSGLLYILLSWSYEYSKEMIDKQLKVSLDYSNSLAMASIEDNGKDLINFSKSVTQDSNLIEVIKDKDSKAIEDLLKSLYDETELETLDILFVKLSKDSVIDVSSSIFNSDLVVKQSHTSAFHNRVVHVDYILSNEKKPIAYIYVSSPLIDKESGEVLGALIIGTFVNDNVALLANVKERTGADNVIISYNNITIARMNSDVSKSSNRLWTEGKTKFKGDNNLVVSQVFKNNTYEKLQQEFIRKGIYIGVICILLIIVFIFFLRHLISVPLYNLVDFASKNKEATKEPNVGMISEFQYLGHKLSNSFHELNLLNKSLEQKVEKRTIDLENKTKELETTIEKLVNMQKRMVAQEKLASLGTLTAGVAHEIKNPLHVIINSANMLERIKDDVKAALESQKPEDYEHTIAVYEKVIQMITNQGLKADKVIKSMLTQARGIKAELVKSSLGDILEETISLAFHATKVKYDQSILPVVSLEEIEDIYLYPQDLGQAFSSILDNSYYALINKSNNKVNGYKPSLKIAMKKENSSVVITIEDNGSGIEKEVLNNIFDPFVTTKPAGDGAGLGLALCHDIIVKHSGIIETESEVGYGTKFIIILPLNLEEIILKD